MTGARVGRQRRAAGGNGAVASLRFRILGPLGVEGADGPLNLGGPKQRIVLAHLIVRAGELVPAQALADALWADDPPESAANVVQTYVSLLRKAIGADRIAGRSGGYTLHLEPADLDATRFEALVREARRVLPVQPTVAVGTLDDALALWRGPALSDVALDPRLLAEAARLDEERITARELRIEAMLAVGQDARAISELETLVPEDPLRESLWALRMRALYRQGRQSDALAAYRQLRRLLRDELGIDPSPDLERLHRQVLEQDPALALRGQPLRGYRLLERLREDRDGTVYRALQPSVGRDVAVRVIGEREASDESFVRGFERRLAAVAALEHPHIAPILDYWREDRQAYVVSRYLRGGTLAGFEARGDDFPADQAARLIDEVASALAHAHHHGVAHGAVSPERVGLDAEGHAYLVDFRVAADSEADSRADTLALLTLARHLLSSDDPLHATLQRLGDDGPDIAADDVVAAARRRLGLADPVLTRQREARNPYKGLRPFGEIDAVDFQGREHLTRRLLARLGERGPQARFLAVVGPSGSGKSSLVKAGLLPLIRAGGVAPGDSVFVSEMFPGRHPIDELASALARVALRGIAPSRGVLEVDDRGLLKTIPELLPAHAELVLVVDQLEELFTVTALEAERDRFLEALRVATVDPSSRLRVIVTLRADFYDRPLLYPRFGELLAARTEAIAPMAADELEAAIRRPAEAVGARIEPGLVSALIADAAHQPGALPLLQYTLTELFEGREDGALTLSGYQSIGTLGGAISARADEVHAGFDPARREATRQVFLRLVTLGEGREDTRRRVERSELTSVVGDATDLDEVLEAYGQHRLLTFDRDPVSREPTVEIAHESLLTHWSRLRGWIDAARDDLRQESILVSAAREWRANGRDPSFLLHGARLDQAAPWAEATSLALGREARAYLKASLDRRDAESHAERERQHHEQELERRSRTRLRALVAVSAVAALVAGLLSIIAFTEAGRAERETRTARARELTGAALAHVETDPELAMLLAVEAVESTRDADGSVIAEAASALHRAIASSRSLATLPAATGAVAWAPDGHVASAGLEPGTIELRDDETWTVRETLHAPGGAVTDLAVSDDGRWLAAASADGSVHVWDRETDEVARMLATGSGPADHLSFSAAGRRLAAAWPTEETARVFETATGDEVASIDSAEVGTIDLSPDGSTLLVPMFEDHDSVGVLLEVDTGQRREGTLAIDGGVHAAAWRPDGSLVATTSLGGIDLWDGATFAHVGRIAGSTGGERLAWSPQGDRLAVGDSTAAAAQVWRIPATEGDESLGLSATETSQGIDGLAFSPDGTLLLAGSDEGAAAKVWSLEPRSPSEVQLIPTVDTFGDVAFSPDSRRLIAADDTGRIRSWDLASGAPSPAFGPRVGQHTFELSPDGTTLALPLYLNGVGAWDVATGRQAFHARVGDVDAVAWAPDGQRLLASVHGRGAHTLVLDRQGSILSQLIDPERPSYAAGFDPSGRFVAVVGFPDEGGGLTTFDWRRGSVVHRIVAPPAGMMAFSPDGRSLATGFGTLAVLDATNGAATIPLEGHPFTVNDVAYSPDGSLIAAALPDGSVQLFDASTGAVRLRLEAGDGQPVGRLAFSPDGSMLASQSPGLVRVWTLDLDELLAIARARSTRPFSEDECRRFLHLEDCPETAAVGSS